MLLSPLLLLFQGPSTALEARPALEVRVQGHLAAYVEDGKPTAISAGVVLPDGRALAFAAGLADRAKAAQATAASRFCAGSTGKTFVAATVLQLVQEGKLRLEDFAGDILGEEPWFARVPNAGDLTVELLLQHRSGLERHEFLPDFMGAVIAAPDREWKPAELVGYLLDREPKFPAGSAFAYSDTNFILLGMIVERVTGKTLYSEVQRRFLDPLELTNIRPQDGRTLPGVVNGYAGKSNTFGIPDEVLGPDGRFILNPQFEWAGGGFVTSGGDLARWARALYAGDVLQPELRARMVSGLDAPETGRGMRYGLGCQLWPSKHGPCWGHGGFFPGYLTEMRYWPERRVAVAVQVNTSEYAALGKPLGVLCEELLELVLDKG
jgi:D-alanyl-D-alanine carboxypeptidase